MEHSNDPVTETLSLAMANNLGADRHLCLISLRGPEKGASFSLKSGESIIGRSEEQSTVVLVGRGISRSHARLFIDGDRIILRDLGSTNGVYVNGQKVEEASLVAGDTLAFGPEVVLRLEWSDANLREVLQELYAGANMDGLTGILNRRSFLNRIREERSAGKRHNYPSCLAMIDIDHFKQVNDTHGHPAGDSVLIQVAAVLSAAIRAEDVVGRYGGEEFIIFLRHSPLEAAWTVLDRIRETIAARPFPVETPGGNLDLSLSISGGIAELSNEQDVEGTIAAADAALYEAKRSGRNQVCKALA